MSPLLSHKRLALTATLLFAFQAVRTTHGQGNNATNNNNNNAWGGCVGSSSSTNSNNANVKIGDPTRVCLHVANGTDWGAGSVAYVRASFEPPADTYSRLHIPNCE